MFDFELIMITAIMANLCVVQVLSSILIMIRCRHKLYATFLSIVRRARRTARRKEGRAGGGEAWAAVVHSFLLRFFCGSSSEVSTEVDKVRGCTPRKAGNQNRFPFPCLYLVSFTSGEDEV